MQIFRILVILSALHCSDALAPVLLAGELTQDHRERYARCLALKKEGRWKEAREVANELVKVFQGDPPSQHQLAFTNELANLDQRLGNYLKAEAGYLTCLPIAERMAGPESIAVGQLKNNLAALYQVLGRFEAAEKLSRETLSIRETTDGENTAGTVPAINNLAGLLWCIGDLDGAETFFRRALAIRLKELEPRSIETARSRANLGGLLYYLNQIEEAEVLVREAARTFEGEFGPEHPETLEILLFLGEIERAIGQPAVAMKLYRQVRDGRIAVFGETPHFETAEAERRLADAQRELGDYEDAIESYSRSETLYRASLRSGHPDLLEGLYGAGLAAIAAGNRELALEKAEACSEIELSNLAGILEFTDERQRLAYQNLYRSHHLFANLGNAERVAEFLLKRKGIVIDSLISEARLMKRADYPEARDAVAVLENARARFRSAFLATGESEIDIDEARESLRRAQRHLLEITGDSGFGDSFLQHELPDLQQHLGREEVLVDYLTFDSYKGTSQFETHIGAVVVSRDSVHFADCGPLSKVRDLIAGCSTFFGSNDPDDEISESLLRQLYETLISSISPWLGEASTVYISPEGPLNFVPFACLLDQKGTFLIEEFDVGYVSAARELLDRSETVDPERGAFLVGNPQFDSRRRGEGASSDQRGLLNAFTSATLAELSHGLVPLAGAEEEVAHLSTLLRSLSIPTRSVYGVEATETRLREEAVRPFLLHLATHGLYLPSLMAGPAERRIDSDFVPRELTGFHNPLFGSWVTLAGSSDTIAAWSEGVVPPPASDGILMANEAAELDLRGTLVVTLSACDTATGEATDGDGVLGIRRGFRIAGAEHVLSTLWPINDAMTPRIMTDFYEGLYRDSPVASLSEAQRKWLQEIRKNPDAVSLPRNDGGEFTVGGLYWAVNLAGPFLLSR